MSRYLLFAIIITLSSLFYAQTSPAQSLSNRDLYEIKIYHLQDEKQELRVEEFLEQAYLPALERAGINKIGVFKPVKEDSLAGKRIFVLIPYVFPEQFLTVPQALEKDQKYQQDGKGYIKAPPDNPAYLRMETILLTAFESWPRLTSTELNGPLSNQVYELRSYESATEDLFENKVKMFNEGETEIFDRLQFNPVFYGEVIAGSNMPNLMYMIAFSDIESRNEHWNSFRKDAAWKQMSVMEEYQNNVSHIDSFLLIPTSYSKI